MARYPEDIINIEFKLRASLSLDIERIITDPVWSVICLAAELDSSLYWPELLDEYLIYYLVREKILTDMVSTNGPADIVLTGEIEYGC
jgi:hypothetical protein